MSRPTTSADRDALPNEHSAARPSVDSVVVNPVSAILAPIRLLGFWTAVALPFLYLPMFAVGLETAAQTAAFLGLLALNLAALLVGHPYRPR